MRKWITTIPDEFLQCRKFGHSWNVAYWYYAAIGSKLSTVDEAYPYQPTPEKAKKGDRVLILKCDRCKTERYDHISSKWGVMMSRKYDYAEDYIKPKDETRPKAGELMVELFNRIPQKDTA